MFISRWIRSFGSCKKSAGLMISAFALSLALVPDFPAEARVGLHQNYELQKVVIFSRHNLRSPMATDSEKRKNLTPHQWQDSQIPPGYLSNRGGLVETMMGESVKDELTRENFMGSPKDWEGKASYFTPIQTSAPLPPPVILLPAPLQKPISGYITRWKGRRIPPLIQSCRIRWTGILFLLSARGKISGFILSFLPIKKK